MRTSSSLGDGCRSSRAVAEIEHPGRAEAALDAAVLEEGRLERAQLVGRWPGPRPSSPRCPPPAGPGTSRSSRAPRRAASCRRRTRSRRSPPSSRSGRRRRARPSSRLVPGSSSTGYAIAVHGERRGDLHGRDSAGRDGYGLAASAGECEADGAPGDHLGHRPAVALGGADVGDRRGGGRGCPCSGSDRRLAAVACRRAPPRRSARGGSSARGR